MMPVHKLEIMGCPCCPVSEEGVINLILSIVHSLQAGYCVAINAEKIWAYGKNDDFKKIIDEAMIPRIKRGSCITPITTLSKKQLEMLNRALRRASGEEPRKKKIGPRDRIFQKNPKTIFA